MKLCVLVVSSEKPSYSQAGNNPKKSYKLLFTLYPKLQIPTICLRIGKGSCISLKGQGEEKNAVVIEVNAAIAGIVVSCERRKMSRFKGQKER